MCRPNEMALQRDDENRGLLLMGVSAALFSTHGIFLKFAADTGLPSTELVFFRAMFQGSIVVAAMASIASNTWEQGGDLLGKPLLRTPFGGTGLVSRVVLLRGLIGGLGFVCYFFTIKALPLGDAITLFSLYPVLTIFLARIVLGEIIRPHHLVATLLSTIGAVMISRPSFLFGKGTHPGSTLGYVSGLLGSCFASGVVVLVRKAGKVGAHTLQLLISWASFGIFFSLVFGFIGRRYDGDWQVPSSKKAWLYVFIQCSLGSCAHFLFNYAGKRSPAGLGSIVRSSDIIWAYLWEVLVFKEVPMVSTIFGVFLILLSLAIIAYEKINQRNVVAFPEEAKESIIEEARIGKVYGSTNIDDSPSDKQQIFGMYSMVAK